MQPFFIQYKVIQGTQQIDVQACPEGLATIIVFADNQQTAYARAGKMIAMQKLEIVKILRTQLISPSHLEMLNKVLASVYTQAELFGVGFQCDFFPSSTDCCQGGHDKAGKNSI